MERQQGRCRTRWPQFTTRGRLLPGPRARLMVGLAIGLALALRAGAAESPPSDFELDVRSEYALDAGWTRKWVWTVGSDEFWIAPIPRWNVRANRTERRLTVLNPNGTSAITLRHSVLTNAPTSAELRLLVSERHPGFRVVDQQDLNSGCGPAIAFDLLRAEEGERGRKAMAAWRTALIVNEGSLLECTLRTSVRSQQDLLRTFGRFLVGLQRPPPEDRTASP